VFEHIEELMNYHNNSPAPLHQLGENGVDMLPKHNPVGFQKYLGAEEVSLPLELAGRGHPYRSLYTGAWNAEEMSLKSLSQFLRHGMGLASWKVDDQGESINRTNYSIDSVCPIEAYVVNYGFIENLKPGLYHFNAIEHQLSFRASFDPELCETLIQRFGEDAFLIGFSHQPWRHSIISQERGWRNTQLDMGHAIASMQLSSATQGWVMNWLQSMNDLELNVLLGLDRDREQAQNEFASSLWCIQKKEDSMIENTDADQWKGNFQNLNFYGQVQNIDNQQSSAEVIKKLQAWCRWPGEVYPKYNAPLRGEDERWLHPIQRSEKILRSLRPAEEFEAEASLSREDFFAILDKTLPRSKRYPFDGFSVAPKVHLLLFVHRVEEMQPGLYLLSRDQKSNISLKSQLAKDFEWQPEGGPVNFFRLQAGDFRKVTSTLWNQSNLGESAMFHVMMLADFDKSVRLDLSTYPHIFWESGMIAQVLSTEATALHHRTHHLAHFIDEQCHLMLGLRADQFRCTYLSSYGQPSESKTVYKAPYYHL
jgi:hypothetical protein